MLAVEGFVGSGRDVVTLHECLGKILRALEYGTSLRRTDDRHYRIELIINALHQRVFWSYNNHSHVVVSHKLLDAFKVISLEGYVLTFAPYSVCASITWCDEKGFTLVTLGYLPCHGVFTTA